MKDTKICPYCGEEIKAVAKKCRFCGQWLDEETSETAPIQVVEPETEPLVEKPASKETDDKPRIETNSKDAKSSNKSVVYWIVGVLAAALLIGVGFLLGNKDTVTSNEQTTGIEENDPQHGAGSDRWCVRCVRNFGNRRCRPPLVPIATWRIELVDPSGHVACARHRR